MTAVYEKRVKYRLQRQSHEVIKKKADRQAKAQSWGVGGPLCSPKDLSINSDRIGKTRGLKNGAKIFIADTFCPDSLFMYIGPLRIRAVSHSC